MKGLALAGLALACAVLDDAPPASRRAWLDLSSDEARQLWEHAWALTNRTAAAQDHQDECRRECANTEAPRANPTNPIALACDRAAAVKATADPRPRFAVLLRGESFRGFARQGSRASCVDAASIDVQAVIAREHLKLFAALERPPFNFRVDVFGITRPCSGRASEREAVSAAAAASSSEEEEQATERVAPELGARVLARWYARYLRAPILLAAPSAREAPTAREAAARACSCSSPSEGSQKNFRVLQIQHAQRLAALLLLRRFAASAAGAGATDDRADGEAAAGGGAACAPSSDDSYAASRVAVLRWDLLVNASALVDRACVLLAGAAGGAPSVLTSRSLRGASDEDKLTLVLGADAVRCWSCLMRTRLCGWDVCAAAPELTRAAGLRDACAIDEKHLAVCDKPCRDKACRVHAAWAVDEGRGELAWPRGWADVAADDPSAFRFVDR